MRLIWMIPLACLSLISSAIAADSGHYIGSRNGVDLLSSPRQNAEIITHAPRKTVVTIVQKRRGWLKIAILDDEKTIGWVYEGAVRKRYVQSTQKSVLSSLSSFFRASAPVNQTAVLGVRGLDHEDELTSAKVSAKQVHNTIDRIDQMVIKDTDIAAFIEQGDLNP